MLSRTKRLAIRRQYRTWRLFVDLTQDEVEGMAGLLVGRYWKIENGYQFPTAEERKRIARILRVSEDALPRPVVAAEPSAVDATEVVAS